MVSRLSRYVRVTGKLDIAVKEVLTKRSSLKDGEYLEDHEVALLAAVVDASRVLDTIHLKDLCRSSVILDAIDDYKKRLGVLPGKCRCSSPVSC